MASDDLLRPTRFQPLGVYRGLDAGPNWVRQNVESESLAIDGTKQSLRDARLGSPFTFRVAPPSVLLEALLGKGEARTQDAFDPLLRKAFQEAEARYLEVLAQTESGVTGEEDVDPAAELAPFQAPATQDDLEAARQGLLGTRAPPRGQNIGIIEAAQRSNNNFSKLVDQRNQFRQSSFFATGPTRGATLARLEKMIARNGIQFNPKNAQQSDANQPAVADLIQALDAIVQLNRMVVTPALTLLVNPEQLQITYAKRQTYSDRNRFNYIFQSWGEEQVRLSVSGRSGGFVVGSRGPGDLDLALDPAGGGNLVVSETAGVSGYQYASKWDSAAWQNLMGLFTFYRNNGYIYDTAGRPRSEAHLFIGNIEISYDQWVYVGNFENFQYNYEETKQQGSVPFSFEFTASYVYDRSQGGAVRPYDNPPTPSPAQSSRRNIPFIPEQEAKATASAQGEGAGEQPILDPIIDPFRGGP